MRLTTQLKRSVRRCPAALRASDTLKNPNKKRQALRSREGMAEPSQAQGPPSSACLPSSHLRTAAAAVPSAPVSWCNREVTIQTSDKHDYGARRRSVPWKGTQRSARLPAPKYPKTCGVRQTGHSSAAQTYTGQTGHSSRLLPGQAAASPLNVVITSRVCNSPRWMQIPPAIVT